MAEKKYDHSKYGNNAEPNGVMFVKGARLKVRDVKFVEFSENKKEFKKGKTYRIHTWLLEGIPGDAESAKKSLKGQGYKYKEVEAPKKPTIEEINTSDLPKAKK